MKPKERFYGYALLPNCDRNPSAVKDDSPIDLSTKRHSPAIGHSISPFASPGPDFEPQSTDGNLGYNEWSAKYLLSNTTARNLQIQNNPNLLPYLLLNRNHCLDVGSPLNDPALALKTPKTEIVYDQFGNPYRVGTDHSLVPLRSSPYIELYKSNALSRSHLAQNGSHLSSATNSSSNSSSPSTNSTNNSHEYHETKRLLERSPTNSSLCATPDALRISRSHSSANKPKASENLIRSTSFPSILSALNAKSNLSKSKSESSLHYLSFEKYERKVSYKPKSLAISRYSNGENIERIADQIRKNNQQRLERLERLEYNKHYYKSNENENIVDSDNDKEDIIESGVSDDYGSGSDDALDLRVTHSLPPKFRPDLSHTDPEHLFHQINTFLNQGSPPAKDELSSPTANPLDLYRQYYYYLMHQPALASRAVAAVAVAETYAKLLSSAHNNRIDDHNSIDNCDNNTSIHESENQSPDYLLNGSRAELRSADTTNNGITFDRKRISRPLTGKHVRHGTGASPSTLISLRNMIQQRQRLKEIGALDANKFGKGKAGKRLKRK